jgi:hypothetical protein
MLRYLVEVLPVMVAPRWVGSRCQPIAVRDVLAWLVSAATDATHDGPGHRVVEVGGPDVVTYRQMLQTYAEVAGLPRRLVLPVPLLTPRLSSLWVGLVTPLPSSLARPLVDSLVNDVVVTQPPAGPSPVARPLPLRRAIELALQRSADLAVSTRWSDADLPGSSPAAPMPTDPEWAGGSLLVDHQTAHAAAPAAALYESVASLGGERGWEVATWLWQVRGWVDKLVGGVGMRRGRRHPTELGVGDAVDFWRVEAAERPSLVRLRAEMRLPGEAWLEWRITPTAGGAYLDQRAVFVPRGLFGRAYWYALLPFHALIFGRLARRLAGRAEAPSPGAVPSARVGGHPRSHAPGPVRHPPS